MLTKIIISLRTKSFFVFRQPLYMIFGHKDHHSGGIVSALPLRKLPLKSMYTGYGKSRRISCFKTSLYSSCLDENTAPTEKPDVSAFSYKDMLSKRLFIWHELYSSESEYICFKIVLHFHFIENQYRIPTGYHSLDIRPGLLKSGSDQLIIQRL